METGAVGAAVCEYRAVAAVQAGGGPVCAVFAVCGGGDVAGSRLVLPGRHRGLATGRTGCGDGNGRVGGGGYGGDDHAFAYVYGHPNGDAFGNGNDYTGRDDDETAVRNGDSNPFANGDGAGSAGNGRSDRGEYAGFRLCAAGRLGRICGTAGGFAIPVGTAVWGDDWGVAAGELYGECEGNLCGAAVVCAGGRGERGVKSVERGAKREEWRARSVKKVSGKRRFLTDGKEYGRE